jgi:hypothetical protein
MKSMDRVVSLTVSESKRLIAKGIVNLPLFQEKLQKGMIAIAKGTTNSYIVEEVLKKKIKKINYTTGLTIPEGIKKPSKEELPDVVLKDGKIINGVTAIEGVKEMQPGDLFIKGANAINYSQRQAAILIGHPTSGTIGATYNFIIARKITLLIPVGLEKLVFDDLFQLSLTLREAKTSLSLFPISGLIFTEIEAIKTFGEVSVSLISKGGVLGAEGGSRFLLRGRDEEVKEVVSVINSIVGEPPFGGTE